MFSIKDDENNTYLYWIEDNPGQCITNEEKPNNCYLEDDIIYYCYETCGTVMKNEMKKIINVQHVYIIKFQENI